MEWCDHEIYDLCIISDSPHCFMSGIIPKTYRWSYLPQLCDSLMISMQVTQKRLCCSKSILQGACLHRLKLSFRARGCSEAFCSTTILETCGAKTSSGGQDDYILKYHLDLLLSLRHIAIHIVQCEWQQCSGVAGSTRWLALFRQVPLEAAQATGLMY